MNKFTEQNKAVEKSDTQAKTNKNGSAAVTTTEISQMGKAATADKAKVTAAPQQLTATAKKTHLMANGRAKFRRQKVTGAKSAKANCSNPVGSKPT